MRCSTAAGMPSARATITSASPDGSSIRRRACAREIAERALKLLRESLGAVAERCGFQPARRLVRDLRRDRRRGLPHRVVEVEQDQAALIGGGGEEQLVQLVRRRAEFGHGVTGRDAGLAAATACVATGPLAAVGLAAVFATQASAASTGFAA